MIDQINDELKLVCLGYNTFDKFVIFLGLNKDIDNRRITFLHEYTHQCLNTSTNYGMLINRVVKNLSSNDDNELLLNFLIENCRTIHEMLATFFSITAYGKVDLISNYPEEYQRYYHAADKIASLKFNNAFLKIYYFQSICRLAMMNNTLIDCIHNKDFSFKYISSIFSPEDYPSYRFNLIIDMLENIPQETILTNVKKFCSDHELEYLSKCENIFELSKYENITDLDYNVSSAFNDCLLEMIEPTLPGISDSCSEGRIIRATDNHSYVACYINRKYHQRNELEFYQIMGICDQVVKVFDISKINIKKFLNNKKMLNIIINDSLNLLNTLFLYIKYANNEASYTAYIIGTKVEEFMRLYDITDQLEKLNYPNIIVIEWNDYQKIVNSNILNRNAFIHIDYNIINFLETFIIDNQKIVWNFFKVGYSNFPIDENCGLYVCYFWINNIQCNFFSLANEFIVEALIMYTDEFINDNELIVLDNTKTMEYKLISHPIFKFYIFGLTPNDYI